METGTPVAEVIRRMGVSEQTFHRRTKVYGRLGVGKLRRVKQLEDESRRLKEIEGYYPRIRALAMQALRRG